MNMVAPAALNALMLRQAQHEGFFVCFILSLSKDEAMPDQGAE